MHICMMVTMRSHNSFLSVVVVLKRVVIDGVDF